MAVIMALVGSLALISLMFIGSMFCWLRRWSKRGLYQMIPSSIDITYAVNF